MLISLRLIIEFVILIFLLFFSAFFSGSETALLSLNKLRIKKLAREGDENAIIVEELIKDPETLLTTILIGNNLVNIATASIATAIAISFFGSKGIGIATGIVTLTILIFGEIMPKSISAGNADKISLIIAKPIKFFVKLFKPLVYLINFIIPTKKGKKRRILVTEDEIRLIVEMGEKEGVIEKEEKEMIKGVFEVGDMVAKEVMIPRVDMVCIEVNESIDEALKLIRKTGFSRIPVYKETRDNIVGILYAKDLIRHLDKKTKISIKDIMRPPFFIPETKSLRELLKEMQKRKIHMAIVVDEYGGTAGLVTLEDIIEEIVGEIMDEIDEEEKIIMKISENEWIVNARARIEEVNEELGLDIPEEEFETIGGLVFNKIGKIPKVGDYIEIDGIKIIVEKMRDKRIRKVRIVKLLESRPH